MSKPRKRQNWRIPAEADWGNYQADLDTKWAHKQFIGRSNEEMQPYIRGAPLGAAEDLRFMPELPFRYYILGYRDYVMAGDFKPYDAPGAASCFINLVLRKLEDQPRYIVPVMPELLPALTHVAWNQTSFQADEHTYGSFMEMLKRIEALYHEMESRYRRL